ncbi:LytR/AlgR family response regulator transcription factor [Catalinimonas niigatensis]|uniref:LytR/AlgR family response regulator transcription factor n=1 Tax=Catalinimonas niigatensis TaxID=1397264 RepID=UPI0026668C0E|nr:LytTR family DNA-binding domain-containing protein [Catalinimonas niigatensis]WPP52096.1 LytTR family DNA-binding domain-containing protein [Catalinimonas niigatensis]
MKVLIVEDEPISSERLREQIKSFDKQIEVHTPLDSIKDTVDFFRSGVEVDVAFFDIQLSDGSSFEVFSQVNISTPIIFTTAYDQYALQAFKVNSIDYLLKPIDYKELSAALIQYKNFHERQRSYDPLLQSIYQQLRPQYKKRFLVKIGDNYQSKSIEDIALFYADGKTTYLITTGSSRRYIIDYTLETLESKMLDPSQFFRINRKFIVNVDALSEVKSYVNGRLKVLTSHPGPSDMIVSRERVNDFKIWLNQ